MLRIRPATGIARRKPSNLFQRKSRDQIRRRRDVSQFFKYLQIKTEIVIYFMYGVRRRRKVLWSRAQDSYLPVQMKRCNLRIVSLEIGKIKMIWQSLLLPGESVKRNFWKFHHSIFNFKFARLYQEENEHDTNNRVKSREERRPMFIQQVYLREYIQKLATKWNLFSYLRLSEYFLRLLVD